MKAMEKAALLSRNKVHRACAERQILELLDHPFLPTLYASFQVLACNYLNSSCINFGFRFRVWNPRWGRIDAVLITSCADRDACVPDHELLSGQWASRGPGTATQEVLPRRISSVIWFNPLSLVTSVQSDLFNIKFSNIKAFFLLTKPLETDTVYPIQNSLCILTITLYNVTRSCKWM